MARAGNRETILEAARRVVHDRGVTGLTFDAVARESGITRPGVMYHFGSRQQLLLATHRHLAAIFEARLLDELAMDYAQSTLHDRLLAYVRACAGVTSRAELLFMLEAALDPAASQIWTDLDNRWLPPSGSLQESDLGARQFIIRLAADGLWLYEATTGESLTATERRRAADTLAALLHDADGDLS